MDSNTKTAAALAKIKTSPAYLKRLADDCGDPEIARALYAEADRIEQAVDDLEVAAAPARETGAEMSADAEDRLAA